MWILCGERFFFGNLPNNFTGKFIKFNGYIGKFLLKLNDIVPEM